MAREDTELFLVDSGIEDLKKVFLDLPRLTSLNLHSNYITRIDNLNRLSRLTHLDLSSNQISRIEGLNSLVNLKYLNLSCNLITIVEGLAYLSDLYHINLSYNQVKNIGGFKRLPANNKLTVIQLQGNELDDATHIHTHLQTCKQLTCVVLHDGVHATNPVCHLNQYYESTIRQSLPSIQSMRKQDVDDISEHSELVDLSPTSDHTDVISSSETPHVDSVLNKFHQVLDSQEKTTQRASSRQRTTTDTDQSTPTPAGAANKQTDQEKIKLETRLAELEKELLKKRIEGMERQLQTTSSEHSISEDVDYEPIKENITPKKLKPKKPAKTDRKQQSSQIPNVNNHNTTRIRVNKPASYQSEARDRSYYNGDECERQAVNNTYQQLMSDLNAERTRRQKSEEANNLLVQQLNSFKTQAKSDAHVRQNCDDAIHKYKSEIGENKTEINELTKQLNNLQTELQILKRTVREKSHVCSEQETAISKLELYGKKLESSRRNIEEKLLKQKESYTDEISELKDKISSSQTTLKTQRIELDEMRVLLAARESEHRKELECRYTLDSPKLEELFQSKISSLIRRHETERRDFEHRLEQADKSYNELEDEFRMALQIEAQRYNELKESYDNLLTDQDKLKSVTTTLKDKETNSTHMIAELTKLVKEQKDKIITLSKEKQEQQTKYSTLKERTDTQLDEQKRQLQEMSRLKKDNLEMKNQVVGQHSVISGLRKERELWGKELAQQGAMLSSERGTLEAKITALTEENGLLRSRIESEADTVKIKTKCVQDLTNSVSNLKQRIVELELALNNKDSEIKTTTESLQKELDEERSHNSTLDVEIDRLTDRKQELKTQLEETQSELDTLKHNHSKLKNVWADKSEVIQKLEEQVQMMKENWENKERRIIEERNKAITAADMALKRLRDADDSFRRQLETQQISHHDRIHELEQQHELQLAEEKQRVELVEDEMRDLLTEKEQNRRQFDDKLKRVNQAFLELQQDLSHSS